MKIILILLFQIVLIGCRNSLSDKEVDAMLDKAAQPKSDSQYVIIGSSQNSTLGTRTTISEASEYTRTLLEYTKKINEINSISNSLNQVIKEQKRINKRLTEHLAGQNRNMNSTPWVSSVGGYGVLDVSDIIYDSVSTEYITDTTFIIYGLKKVKDTVLHY